MSDDYPDNFSTNGLIPYNGPGVTANIETPGDVDWFGFNDDIPNRFHVTNAQFEYVRIQVISMMGPILAHYYGPAAGAFLDWTPPPPDPMFPGMDHYYVAVTGFTASGAQATGTYTLSATPVNDDHPDTHTGPTTGVTIDGPAATGVINFPQDWDTFHINDTIPEPVRIEVTSADFTTVMIYALGATGNVVANYTGPLAGASFVAPPGAEFVRIIGFDASGNYTTGAYSFTVSSIPDDHGDTFATATPITAGGPPVTSVNEGGDWDVFSFQGVAGEHVYFDWLTLPPSGSNYMIYDQYGRSLYFTNGAMHVDHYHSFTPTITGTYYLFLNSGGTTGFQLMPGVDDYPDTLPTNGVLTVDGPVVHGRHDFHNAFTATGDFDLFSINFAAAGVYRIEITPLSLYFQNELLAFYDSEGNFLSYRVLLVPGEGLTLEIDTPGTYYVGVEQLVGLVNSDQMYNLWAYSTTDDYGQTINTTGEILIGGPATTGAINYNEDVDWLRFEVTGNQVLEFTFATTGFYAHDFQIMNEDGALLTWVDDDSIFAGGDTSYFLSFTPGTYYFALGDPMGGRTFIGQGTYSVGISVVPGLSSLPDPLTVQTPAEGELFYAEGDHDVLVFTAQAGQTIRFDAESDGYWWRMSLYHYDSNGVFTWDVLEPLRYDAAFGFTFPETGTYYLNFTGAQHTSVSSDDLGAYTITSQVISDTAGSHLSTAAPLIIDGPAVHGQIDYENDIDWFSFTVEAGDTIYFELTNPSGAYLTTGGGNRLEGLPGNVVRYDTAGTYYYAVQGFYWEETGATYSVTAVTYTGDALRNDVMTTGAMTVGGPAFTDTLNYSSDHDWVAVQLEAGENYIFTVTGHSTPGNYLNGTIEVFDLNGVELETSGFNSGQTTTLIYTANYTGTHYLGIWAQGVTYTSPFTLTANEYTPPLLETVSPGLPAIPDDSFDHEHVGPPNVINLYFAEGGDEFGAIISDGWFAEEIDAVMAVLSAFEGYLNIDFQITDFLPNADLVLTTFEDPGTTTIFQRADWDVPIPVIGFSYASPLWTEASLTPGGLGAAYVLNAMGFALGLAFPHEQEGDSYAMEGVFGAFDLGDFDLNQGVFTIMSFNDGWVTSPYGQSSSDNFGWQATPMAIDIAALQAIYGANPNANAGASTYTLAATNAAGTGWRSIWDTGGADTIVYSGAGAAHIDLRAATLDYATGGAGFLSYVTGIHGGFTIANGVVIENATGGSGNDTLIGNSAANTLTGGDGADTLNGGAGADTMIGGDGDDTYVIDHTNDVISETSALGGTDTVQSSLTRTLGANLENLVMTGAAAINGFGNALNNTITGNGAANQLNGFDGNDILDGGAGGDSMFGGNGDDAYYVDNSGDLTTETSALGGTDIVYSSVSRNLTAHIENLTLTGGANTTGSGNTLNNLITGNAGANTLYGFEGNDRLDGGAGADTLFGAAGNDTYVIDNVGDITVEGLSGAAGGVDTVETWISRNLNANFENMTLLGSATIAYGNILANALTGNALANALYGFEGNDTLDGGAGADNMFGADGDDTYVVDNAGDVTSEVSALGGTDTVISSVERNLTANLENLILIGSASINGAGNGLNNVITGNSGVNTLYGLGGDDRLDGGTGADVLQGGAGADEYVFSTTLGGGNVDAIVGFNVADDTIVLSNAVFTGLGVGALAANAFTIGAAAADADDRIIYNSATGQLYFDADGNGAGAAVLFATLSAGLSLTSADFIIGGP